MDASSGNETSNWKMSRRLKWKPRFSELMNTHPILDEPCPKGSKQIVEGSRLIVDIAGRLKGNETHLL